MFTLYFMLSLFILWTSYCYNKYRSFDFKGGKEKKEKYYFTVLRQIQSYFIKIVLTNI